jgi:hypothetical protein
MTRRTPACLGLGLLLLAGVGCPSDDSSEENVLPSGTSSNTSDTEMTTETTDTGADVEYPATYRFDCIDIRGIGNGGPDLLQAQILEQAWSQDIMNHKLNILLEVFSVDDAGGSAEIGIRSGIGTGDADQCAEPSSASPNLGVGFTPGATTWAPSGDPDSCSVMQAGEGYGDFNLMLAPTDVFYIYAEDDTTVTFNCTPDAATPDAVPIRAVEAQVSADASRNHIAGTLLGCLNQAEAMALCSCVGACYNADGDVAMPGEVIDDPDPMETCNGCPVGSAPLESLLGNVETSDRCTSIMGEPSFDLEVGFTATALPGAGTTLAMCGG